MIQTIYLDLDDVLNVFTPYVLSRIGGLDTRQRHLESRARPNCGTWDYLYGVLPVGDIDIVDQANRLIDEKLEWHGGRFTVDSFWEGIPRDVWSRCPRSGECTELLRMCLDYVPKTEVYIATSTTKNPECLSGKLEWIHDNLPKWLHRQYFVTPRKVRLARPGDVLIDDNETNCREFEKRGGVAIRFPRPWNVDWMYSPLPRIRYLLQKAYEGPSVTTQYQRELEKVSEFHRIPLTNPDSVV